MTSVFRGIRKCSKKLGVFVLVGYLSLSARNYVTLRSATLVATDLVLMQG